MHDLEHRAKAYWSYRCSNCCQGQVLDNLKRRSGQVEHHTLAWQDDPVSGETTTLRCSVAGVFFARSAHRHVLRGMNVGKVAGAIAFRGGSLLSQ